MANSIERRVAEFISAFPPFDRMTEGEVNLMAQSVQIRYHDRNEALFCEGDAPTPFFYVVRKGSVRIEREDQHHTLVDLCDEGDVFGVRPLLANESYLASARAAEESLIYAIPVDIGLQVLRSNPEVGLYLARGYASGMPMSRQRRQLHHPFLQDYGQSLLPDIQKVVYSKDVLTCSPETSIRKAAEKMAERNVASILIVDENAHPQGIMTDSDLRRKVVSKGLPTDEPVLNVMSSPVSTVDDSIVHTDALLLMLTSGVHHLCVTKNGTPASPVLGILSLRDLMVDQGLHPAVIAKSIKEGNSSRDWLALRPKVDALFERYLESNTPAGHVSAVNSTISDLLIQLCIDSYIESNGPPPTPFVWLSLGSMGRKEQILPTDQDHVLITKDQPGDNEYFINLAKSVEQLLEQWGLSMDMAGINASNPEGIQSLERWKEQFTHWIQVPDPKSILNATIYFDFRPVYGDKNIAEALKNHITSLVSEDGLFLPYLALDALNTPPPLSFFRQFIVEKDGVHKDEFDLKLRVMLPFCDVARLLCLEKRDLQYQNTAKRFNHLAESDSKHAELYRDAAEAYQWLMALRWKFGSLQDDTGRYIAIEQLSKSERQTLRDIFATLSELDQMVKVRFRTDILRQ